MGIRTFDLALDVETVEVKAVAPTSAEAMELRQQKNLKVIKGEAIALVSEFNREKRGVNLRTGSRIVHLIWHLQDGSRSFRVVDSR